MLKTFKVTIASQDVTGEGNDFYLCQVKEVIGAADTVIHEVRINPNRGTIDDFIKASVEVIEAYVTHITSTEI